MRGNQSDVPADFSSIAPHGDRERGGGGGLSRSWSDMTAVRLAAHVQSWTRALGPGRHRAPCAVLDMRTGRRACHGKRRRFVTVLQTSRTAKTDGNGGTTYYAYDALNRVSGITDPLGGAAEYSYDATSNLHATVDNKGVVVYFGYDALSRRIRIVYPGGSYGYGTQAYGTTPYGGGGGAAAGTQYFAYDAVGNLTGMLDGWGASYFVYDALNRVSHRGTPRGDSVYYAYDAVSNLAALRYPQGTACAYYAYDAANRMTALQTPAARGCYFAYDESSNLRKTRLGNGVTVSSALLHTPSTFAYPFLRGERQMHSLR